MKKTLLIVALALVSFAQAQKGTFLLMGSVGVSSSKTDGFNDERKVNSFNFSPKVGYQFTDHWTLGLEAGIGSEKTEHNYVNNLISVHEEDRTTSFEIGPFARYSRPISEIFSWYADLGIGYRSYKMTSETAGNGIVFVDPDAKGSGMYARITPAIFINVKKGFGLNVSFGGLGFNSLNDDDVNGVPGNDNSNFYFNFGQTVNIGISKNF